MSKHTFLYFTCFISFSCYIIFYIGNIQLLHTLSPAEFGDIYSTIKVLVLLSSLTIAAKQVTMTLYKPQFERTHRHLHRLGLINWLSTNLATSAFIFAIGGGLSIFLHQIAVSSIFQAAFQSHPVHFILFFMPILLFCVVIVSLGLSQPNISTRTSSLLTIIPSITITAILILGIQVLQLRSLSVLLTFLISQMLIFIIYFFITYQFDKNKFLKKNTPREHQHYYSHGDRFWLSTFSYQLSIGLSLLVLDTFNSEAIVGQYAIILLFAIAYFSILSPLYTYLSSQLDLKLEVNPSSVCALLRQITRIQFASVLVLTVISMILGGYIAPENSTFQYTIIFACVLFSICMLTAPALRVLLHSKYVVLGQRLQVLQLGVTTVLLIILIPPYGIVGALIADTIPLIITHIVAYYICQYSLNIHPIPLK
ncbi:hypothetical protein OAT84_00280 [Gammaproteobacteria bacterium]|nr:hypothetical protein [Gammaproteobacteria bacterium]